MRSLASNRDRSDPAGAEPGTTGIVPTLAELVALGGVARAYGRAGRAAHGVRGSTRSSLRGRGMEYAESREYTRGDDARHVDWRVTARTGRVHTKLFQAERERLTLLVADTAPSLYFGTRVRFKSVQAARAGAVATWSAIADGDRVAALRGSDTELLVHPAAGTRGALRVLDALVRWYAAPPQEDAGLPAALDHARRLLRPGSRLLVLAEAASIAAVPLERWPALSAHNQVVVLLLDDRLEREPPQARLPFAVDGHRVELDLGERSTRQRWRQAFGGKVDEAAALLRARGVGVGVLSTDEPSESWLHLFGGMRR